MVTRGTLAHPLGSVLDFGMCFEFWEVYLDSGMCFWILGSFLGSGTCFGFWDVFWILGSVLEPMSSVGYWRCTEIRREETRDDNTRREILYFQAAM